MKKYWIIITILVVDILVRLTMNTYADIRPTLSPHLFNNDLTRVYLDAQLDEFAVQVNRKPGPKVNRADIKAKGKAAEASKRAKNKHNNKP